MWNYPLLIATTSAISPAKDANAFNIRWLVTDRTAVAQSFAETYQAESLFGSERQIRPLSRRKSLPRCQACTPSSSSMSTERSW